MKTYTIKKKLNIPADDIIKLMTTVEYAQEEAIVEGAISAKARIEKNDGDNMVIIVERADPTRGAGGIDMKKTEKVTLRIAWNIAERKSRWNVKVHGIFEKLVDVSGETWFVPEGDVCTVMHETGTIDIRVPLIGNIVAAGLVNDIRGHFPEKAELIEKKLKKDCS